MEPRVPEVSEVDFNIHFAVKPLLPTIAISTPALEVGTCGVVPVSKAAFQTRSQAKAVVLSWMGHAAVDLGYPAESTQDLPSLAIFEREQAGSGVSCRRHAQGTELAATP
jgi:hypothetical protein